MRKILCALLGAIVFCGCREVKPVREEKIKIGVSVYDSYDTFITELMTDFNSAVAEYENMTVEVYNASNSQQTQNKQMETMLDNGCDVICINLVDRTSPKKIIDLARKHDVPVIFFNRELVEEDLLTWEELYYVGADAAESGIMQGEIAAEIFRDEAMDKNKDGVIQYIVLEGEAGHQDAIVRTERSVDTLIEAGFEVDKIASAIANWSRSQAQSRMASFIDAYGEEIELVLGNNDDMALGAIDAYRAAGIGEEDWPVIIGIDGTEAGLQAVVSGEMAGTVFNDQKGQAKAMASLAYALAGKRSLSGMNLKNGRYIRLPYSKVTRENVSDYLD
ncbi:MAG: galactose ABC transporter substrate-binding protein [Solobacterium sp.]|nr:galactose ABC transporter substrate-binding protein [Solobacterium sp.]